MQAKTVDITERGKKIIADAYMQLLSEGNNIDLVRELAVDWGIDICTMYGIVREYYTDDEINHLREQNKKAFRQWRKYSPPGHMKAGCYMLLHMEETGRGRYIKRPKRPR